MPSPARSLRRRLSVTAYLVAAFGACAVSLALVTVQTSRATFERERDRAGKDLRAITRETQASAEEMMKEVKPFTDGYATDPRILTLEPAQCALALSGLEGLLQSEHIHVLAADGTEVCAAYGSAATRVPLARGAWFSQVIREGKTVTTEPDIDPASGRPAILIGIPLRRGAGAPVGALVAVTTTSRSPITVPIGAPQGAVVLLLDAKRDLVLAASANAPASVGARVGNTALGASFSAGRTLTDLDGTKRIYEQVDVAASGWHVLAGVETDVAFASARAELKRNLVAGATTLALVFLLAVLLHRRLARPIRRVGRAITASLEGDADARAPRCGPSELVQVADVFNDLIEERAGREAELYRRAREDALTGLPNRTALTERLDAALAACANDPYQRVVVLFLDLDRFKHINDAHGHATGDQVLVALGARLEAALAGLFVSRFGGDEYVMVATGPFTSKNAGTLAERVAATMQTPIEVNGSDLHLTGSIGIAVARTGDTAEDLIRNADTAMYRSKETGTDGYAVFDQPMRDWVMHRASVEGDLHQAIEDGQLWLSYQPKLALAGAGPAGFEALARWSHPTRGLVPPCEFIPVAEETGLISVIGAWAMEEACRQAAEWRAMNGDIAVPVAVNLAARQLADPKLPDLVAQALERSGAEPRDLVLEVTESAVLFDTDAVSKRLRRLRDAGVRISIDDFGTGYSSLSYLQHLPIDELKIDRAFVSRLPFEPSSTAIIGSVIDLAHAIGLDVVAEGVETLQQLEALRELRCDLAQGFFIARPEPAGRATLRVQAGVVAQEPAPRPALAALSSGTTYSAWA